MNSESFFIPEKLSVKGGKAIKGTVEISGAKNSILGLMAAALLTDEEIVLHNVPYITDVLEMGHIMLDLGVNVQFNPEKKILYLHAKKITNNVLNDKALKFRASYYLWGSLLARFKHTNEFNSLKVCVPGGCSFGGKRPTDFHEQLIKNIFGAEITEEHDGDKNYLVFGLPKEEPENVNPIYTTAKVSHGATFHWLLSIAGTKDFKMMYNSSLEPEVSNLISMLQKMGLDVIGNESTGLVYNGKNRSLLKGGIFEVIPDRLEAATYALLALGARGTVQIKGINLDHCSPWLKQLTKVARNGIYYSLDKKEMILDFRDIDGFDGFVMQMSPYPGFETDVQQIWCAVLGLAKTDSVIVDMIWPGRSAHLLEMQKFGLQSEFWKLDVASSQNTSSEALFAHIIPSKIKPATAKGMDLRGTMGIIVLASIAKGKSTIKNPEFALRGYPNLVKNLEGLGIEVVFSKEGSCISSLPIYRIKE
ncbi:MAG: hypothetical protein LBR70_00840 [Lactobacillaceae bacterium]|jgi:UDP-N-acetylglucosamine 1-carboxyvinyltransferase|nr:hypothetical protein [Lactobacillaceae bacterium]